MMTMLGRRRKVALVGMASSSRHLAPFGNPAYEVWGLNELHCKGLPGPWHRWFELHSRERIENSARTPDHLRWLRECGIPVYMQKCFTDIPTSVEYPLWRVSGIFGRYFTSTPAFMLALAITERFERVELYGMDMALATEYFQQRPCMEYLIGFARGCGTQIIVPPSSPLLKADYLEGYEEAPPLPESVVRGADTMENLERREGELVMALRQVSDKRRGLLENERTARRGPSQRDEPVIVRAQV